MMIKRIADLGFSVLLGVFLCDWIASSVVRAYWNVRRVWEEAKLEWEASKEE